MVLTAGRGLGSRAGCEKLALLAQRLGAQVAATRGAADAGWLGRDREIGLSGLRVAPELYVGCGVSGANFHTIGMEHAGCIVGINTDPTARIFELAHIRVVADVGETLGRLERYLDHAGTGRDPVALVKEFFLGL